MTNSNIVYAPTIQLEGSVPPTSEIPKLTLSMLGKISRRHFEAFSQKIGFGISCKLAPQETICMKCQTQFSEKNNFKNITLVCRLMNLPIE